MTGPPPATWAVDPLSASARELLPGLWRLRLPLAWEEIDHVNAYLVERGTEVMLVDCGAGGDPSCLEALERALDQTGHRLTDITALVLTHAHSDHLGLARTVLEASGAELWANPNTAHFYDPWHDPSRVQEARRRRARLEGVPEDRLDAYADVREELTGADGIVTPDHPLSDGVRIPSGLGPWEVIETAGHAPSHVSLLQRERGLLIAGDIVCIAFVPWMDYGYSLDPFAESLRSLDLLEAERCVTLTLPGHGRPLDELDTTIAGHRAGFEARLDAARQAVTDRPGTSYELTERLHGVEDDIAAVGHHAELLCLLRHLRLTGEVTRVVEDSTRRYNYEIQREAA